MAHRIVTLPGHGIGPEIMAPALELLRAVGEFEFEEYVFGDASIDAHGTALTDETLTACRGADAVLLAAVGGPRWDTTDPDKPRPEQGLLGLRKGLGLYANLRPVKPLAALYDASPLSAYLNNGMTSICCQVIRAKENFSSASWLTGFLSGQLEAKLKDRARAVE